MLNDDRQTLRAERDATRERSATTSGIPLSPCERGEGQGERGRARNSCVGYRIQKLQAFDAEVPAGVEIYEVNGPFFFGAADKLRDVLSEVSRTPVVMILRMRHVPSIDATGLHALVRLQEKSAKAGTTVIICEPSRSVLRTMVRAGVVGVFGRQNFAKSLDVALGRAEQLLQKP